MVSLILASISPCMITSTKNIHYPFYPTGKKARLKKQNKFWDGGVACMCRKSRVNDWGNKSLEMELLEFMDNSRYPNKFPSKKELIEGGRIDLVEAILKNGGWMSMGWYDNEVNIGWNLGFSFGSSMPVDVSSCDDQSIQVEKEDSGIEGILNRLTRERNQSFGLNLGKNGSSNHVSKEEKKRVKTSKDVDSWVRDRNESEVLLNHGCVRRDNGTNKSYMSSGSKGDAWRTWSLRRAGALDREFEAAEIEVPTRSGSAIRDASNSHKSLDKTTNSNPTTQNLTLNVVKGRLQLLQQELSSVIHSLAPNPDGLSEKASRYLSEDWRQLSDASEFQENELMRAQETLRSMRAKLAVLEGKMALALSDAQEILNERQKRIDGAHRALQLLRTTCIVWPDSGSEVLLAGSYDGWCSQKKMERLSNGAFSLSLKLYPGKYEIKFIVDGTWKVDSLRPIVNHGGFENNLLIVI